MKTTLQIEVQVRPHAEYISVDGVRFGSPEDLWEHLHSLASARLKKPAKVRHTTFLTLEGLTSKLLLEADAREAARIARAQSGRAEDDQLVAERTAEEIGL